MGVWGGEYGGGECRGGERPPDTTQVIAATALPQAPAALQLAAVEASIKFHVTHRQVS